MLAEEDRATSRASLGVSATVHRWALLERTEVAMGCWVITTGWASVMAMTRHSTCQHGRRACHFPRDWWVVGESMSTTMTDEVHQNPHENPHPGGKSGIFG